MHQVNPHFDSTGHSPLDRTLKICNAISPFTNITDLNLYLIFDWGYILQFYVLFFDWFVYGLALNQRQFEKYTKSVKKAYQSYDCQNKLSYKYQAFLKNKNTV